MTDMTDRRQFLRCSACGLVGIAALSLPGCGGDAPTDPTHVTKKDSTVVKTDTTTKTNNDPPKWEIAGSTIRVFVSRVPELASAPSLVVINEASTILIRPVDGSFLAFTAVCTHEGCFVSTFADNRLVCPCHGSTFDLNGGVVVGPATAPLAKYSTSFDATKNEVLITKTA